MLKEKYLNMASFPGKHKSSDFSQETVVGATHHFASWQRESWFSLPLHRNDSNGGDSLKMDRRQISRHFYYL